MLRTFKLSVFFFVLFLSPLHFTFCLPLNKVLAEPLLILMENRFSQENEKYQL